MRTLVALLSLPVLFFTATPAYAHPWIFHRHAQAQDRIRQPNRAEVMETARNRAQEIRTKVEEFRTAAAERRLALIKELCSKMVDHRIKTLEGIRDRLNQSQLTDQQKADLTATIDEKVAAMRDLADDCQAATTVESARTVIRTIQSRHNVFRSILPRLHALTAAHRGQAFVGRIERHTATMERLINRAKDNGCDTAEAEAALADYKAALEEARSHHSRAVSLATTFTNETDPGAKRDEVKAEVKAMVDSLKEARDAFKKVVAELKECRDALRETPTPSEEQTQE